MGTHSLRLTTSGTPFRYFKLGVHTKSETKRPSFCRTPTPSKSEARRTLPGQDLWMESLLSVRVLMYLAFSHPMPTFLP